MAKIPKVIEPIDTDLDTLTMKIMTPTIGFKMQKTVRFHESDLYIPTLRIANTAAGGFISTSDLIENLEAIFNIAGEDAKILDGRSDTKFSQIVRNMVSHRDSPKNFIKKGFAEYDSSRKGIQITVKGRKLLTSIYDPE